MLLLNKKSISIFILICFVIVALPTLIVALNQTQGMGGHVSLNEESQQHAAVSKIDKQKSVSVSQANRNTAVSDDDDQNVTVSDIQPSKVGQELDSYKGVPVYFNGTDYTKSYGESFNSDGY